METRRARQPSKGSEKSCSRGSHACLFVPVLGAEGRSCRIRGPPPASRHLSWPLDLTHLRTCHPRSQKVPTRAAPARILRPCGTGWVRGLWRGGGGSKHATVVQAPTTWGLRAESSHVPGVEEGRSLVECALRSTGTPGRRAEPGLVLVAVLRPSPAPQLGSGAHLPWKLWWWEWGD